MCLLSVLLWKKSPYRTQSDQHASVFYRHEVCTPLSNQTKNESIKNISTVAGWLNSVVLTVRHPAVSAAITWPELNTSWFEALAAAAGRSAPDGLQTHRQRDADIFSSRTLFIHVIFVLLLVVRLPLQRPESSSCLSPAVRAETSARPPDWSIRTDPPCDWTLQPVKFYFYLFIFIIKL